MGFFNLRKREAAGIGGTTTTCTSSSTDDSTQGASYTNRTVYAGTEDAALKVAAVFRAVDLISSSVASLRMEYRRYNKAKECYEAFNYGNRINYLLQRKPNDRMNAYQFWKQEEEQRLLYGRAYIYIEGSKINPDAFILLTPGTVTWNRISNTYTITDETNGIVESDLSPERLICLRNIVTKAYPEGQSTLHFAVQTASLNATISNLQLESASKGGRVRGFLQQDDVMQTHGVGGLSEDQMKKVTTAFNSEVLNLDIPYLPAGKFTQLSQTAQDMALVDTLKLSIRDISRFFGVPSALLMDDTNSTYKTPDAASLEFLTRTLAPRIREIEDEFVGKMLTPEDFGKFDYKMNTDPLFQLDLKSKADTYKVFLETGVASVNELRAKENMSKLSDGDDHYVSCNVAPVGSAKLSGETQAAEPAQEEQDVPKRERNAKGQFVSKKK